MKKRKKQPKQTRAAILEAAGKLIAERGYEAAGIALVVERADVTKGALFHHFRDKASMGEAWIRELLGEVLENRWLLPLEQVASLQELKKRCAEGLQNMSEAHGLRDLAVTSAELLGRDEQMGAALAGHWQILEETISQALARGQKEGWIHPTIRPQNEASFLVSMLCGAAVMGGELSPSLVAALDGYLDTLRIQ
ncbi:MAG: TetR/AcrR family transcriptional regulator [Verrucomicrobia bacterium]|nr:MAG: TetR/AcrR family transcriptional regulator [Verrucomicrobiota bacterium]